VHSSLESLTFQNGSVKLHAVAAGRPTAPLVILLHGFPEFWYSWHKQIAPLADAGFRVIVPDQRGYNLSSKPRGAANYAMLHLVSDVMAIADQLHAEKFFLAGHDWGAAVAWSTALLHPQRVAKLAILNVPHPSVMLRYLRSNLRQIRRSWYMFLLQLPWIPELVFCASNFRFGTRALVNSSRADTFSANDLAQYRAAWSQPGALTAMMNWYRAAARHRGRFPDSQVHVPTRILWGEQDAFLLSAMAHDSLRYCDNAELHTFANSTHWLQHEEPQRVSDLLIHFFQAP
jgi:pimeloyl-ACP methyl ester carboxylesterase